MQLFNLPISTNINRSVPKNSFDKYTTSRQKKLFSELIDKIRWSNKLSRETINLAGKEISEIQLFEITLKKKENIGDLLSVIDRAIPYHIVFAILYNDKVMLSASYKHPHPTNENTAVIDWTFNSDWAAAKDITFRFNLVHSLDHIWVNFCKQLSGRESEKLSLKDLIEKEQKTKEVKLAISTLQVAIKNTRQFNKKVELNLELQKRIREYEKL